MRRVIIESPYRGDVERNVAYARLALADTISRGEAALCSHILYTQVLDDGVLNQAARGILIGFEWYKVAQLCAVYEDYGVTTGMQAGLMEAARLGVPIVRRKIL